APRFQLIEVHLRVRSNHSSRATEFNGSDARRKLHFARVDIRIDLVFSEIGWARVRMRQLGVRLNMVQLLLHARDLLLSCLREPEGRQEQKSGEDCSHGLSAACVSGSFPATTCGSLRGPVTEKPWPASRISFRFSTLRIDAVPLT